MSSLNTNNTMKVKVILGNDIRRWRYNKSESKLSSLNDFVSSSFNLNNFWLQYEDDEGDRLTLSSENDFEDAWTCAQDEDRKSLKIYVIQGSIHSAQRKNSSNANSNVQSHPHPHPQSSQSNGPCQPDPNCDVNKCFEMFSYIIFITIYTSKPQNLSYHNYASIDTQNRIILWKTDICYECSMFCKI